MTLNPFIKTIIRTRFLLTSSQRAETQTRDLLQKYLDLAQGLDDPTGRQPVTVPPMLGIDEDMRDWSFFMILHHNVIVNQQISETIRRLALNEPPPEKKFDIKNDVIPNPDCGLEQVTMFKSSVLAHLNSVKELGDLRNTATTDHPLFGPFDAHKWHCMFAFHLKIHLKQAECVRRKNLAT